MKKEVNPPRLAVRLFKWYCRNHLRDSILGDMEERFQQETERSGSFRAKVTYWLMVFRFFNRHTLKRDSSTSLGSGLLFRSHLVSSFRFLRRNKRFAFINIFGLTTGLTSCLVILFFVGHELSFDRFHDNFENIYRVNMSYEDRAGNINLMANSPPALVPGIKDLYAQVETATHMRYTMRVMLGRGERVFYDDFGYYADSAFLDVFDFDVIAGDRASALDEPNSIVLTRETALRLFDDPNPVGEMIELNGRTPLRVTAIISEVPTNSHLDFNFLISFSSYEVPAGYTSNLTSWRWLGFLSYLKLKPGTEADEMQAALTQLFIEKNPQGRKPLVPELQVLADIYLGSSGIVDDLASKMRGGDRVSVIVLSSIAILILLIAGFNYANLSNAMATNRSKAIGIRKVLGAHSKDISSQVLVESVMLSVVCLVIAYVLAVIAYPTVAQALEWYNVIGLKEVGQTLPVMLVVTLMVGLAAGSYPAGVISRFRVVQALKQESGSSGRNPIKVRNVLVLMQISIAMALISTTFILTSQLDHLRNQTMGLAEENVVVIQLLPEMMHRRYERFKKLLEAQTDVLAVSQSERVIGDPWAINPLWKVEGDRSQSQVVSGNLVGYDFLKAMGLKLKSGRSFSRAFERDSTDAIIVNEEVVSRLDLENPIGQQVHFFDLEGPRTIIGVVENFNYASLHQEIGPVVMVLNFIQLEHMYVRLAPGNLLKQIELVEETWDQVSPGTPIQLRFLDDRLNELYANEERLANLVRIFASLAIILSCLGFYGLIAFMINNRLKEVGIRKVLGASPWSLYLIFVRQFLILVVLASLIAVPLLHYYLKSWLSDFAYRISISPWIYPAAAAILMLVTLLTISYQILKAASVNPVNIIRSE